LNTKVRSLKRAVCNTVLIDVADCNFCDDCNF